MIKMVVKRIHIPFNEWSARRLEARKKFCTSRNKRYGQPGQTFVCIREYVIIGCAKMPLWMVAKYLWRMEGAVSEADFKYVWSQIHPKTGFVPDQLVWVHFFQPYKDKEDAQKLIDAFV